MLLQVTMGNLPLNVFVLCLTKALCLCWEIQVDILFDKRGNKPFLTPLFLRILQMDSQLVLRSTLGKDAYNCHVDDDTENQETSLEMTKIIDLRQKLTVHFKSSALFTIIPLRLLV